MAAIIKVDGSTELGKLFQKVDRERPTAEDKQKLFDYLVKHGTAELAKIGDLSAVVVNTIINRSFPTKQGFVLAIEAKIRQLQEGLGADKASPLEKCLIDNIALCWLRLHDVELRYESLLQGNPTISQADHWERRLTLAQHRYIRAIESLAKVRRLLKEPQSPMVAVLLKQQLGIVNKAK